MIACAPYVLMFLLIRQVAITVCTGYRPLMCVPSVHVCTVSVAYCVCVLSSYVTYVPLFTCSLPAHVCTSLWAQPLSIIHCICVCSVLSTGMYCTLCMYHTLYCVFVPHSVYIPYSVYVLRLHNNFDLIACTERALIVCGFYPCMLVWCTIM